MNGLESALLKLKHARSACDRAVSASSEWSAAQTHTLTAQTEPAGAAGGFDVVVRVHGVATTPASLILDIEDCLHHARSALDHVVWQLAIDAGVTLKKQMFPIFETQPTQRDWERYVGGLSNELQQLIEAVQPFNLPSTARSLLWILHHLDIHSKHRSIVPTAVMVEQFAVAPPEDMNAEGYSLQVLTGIGVVNAAPVFRAIGVDPRYRPPDPMSWMEPIPMTLYVPYTEKTSHFPVQSGLPAVLQHAEEVVSALQQIRSAPGTVEVAFHHSFEPRSIQLTAFDDEGSSSMSKPQMLPDR